MEARSEPAASRDRTHIVHPQLERWQALVRHAVGEAGAAFVEQDQARERREPPQKVRVLGHLPALLDIRDPARNPDQVERPLPDNLIGDVDLADLGIKGPGPVHTGNLRPSVSRAYATSEADLAFGFRRPPSSVTRCAAGTSSQAVSSSAGTGLLRQ